MLSDMAPSIAIIAAVVANPHACLEPLGSLEKSENPNLPMV